MAGTNFDAVGLDSGVTDVLRNGDGLTSFGHFTGSPSFTANEYEKGCILIKTDAANGVGALYENTGTPAIPAFSSVHKVFTAQRTLTNAQILALNGTALPIVTAVSAGLTATQIIMPIEATMAYTFAVAAYATNTELDLIHAGATTSLLKTDIGQAASTFAKFADNASAAAGNNFVANADLNLFVPTGNPTGGDVGASIKVTVFYTIMDVI